MFRRPPRLPIHFWAQAAIALPLVGGLLLTPPAQGAMMLVPLTPAAAHDLPMLALRGDAKLIAAGPVPGSLLVEAHRAGFAGPLLAHAVLAFASPPGGCSPKARA